MFTTTPLTRYLRGECGSIWASMRSIWSVTFSHQIWPQPRKEALLGREAVDRLPTLRLSSRVSSQRHQREAQRRRCRRCSRPASACRSGSRRRRRLKSPYSFTRHCGALLERLGVGRRSTSRAGCPGRRTCGPRRRSRASARGRSPRRCAPKLTASSSVRVEERRLQDAGGEVDVVHLRIVVGVDRGRRHVPLLAVHRLADLVQLAVELELVLAR